MNILAAADQYDPILPMPEPDDLVGQRIALGQQLKYAESVVEKAKEAIQALDYKIIEQWEREETNHTSRMGSTLYLHTTRYAKTLVDDDTLNQALTDAGYGAIVKRTVNRNTLTATLKELDDMGGIPESLNDVVRLDERIVLRQRNAR